ncbi:Mss4-like protein [Ilyonectria destructans]|nr:Mss4-like protein [Ilyonectria destructans]
MVLTGGCVCGAVRYTAEVDTGVKAVCHCLNCQRRTASAFSVNVIIPRDSFKITQGTTKSHTYLADSNKLYHTHFCGDCGSALYGEPEAFPDTVSIKAGSLDEAFTDLGTIDAEAFVVRRKNYLKPLEGVKQVDGMISP